MPLSNCPFCSQVPLYFSSHIGCPEGQTHLGNWACTNAPYVGPGTLEDMTPIWEAAVLGTDPGSQGGRWQVVDINDAGRPAWYRPQ